MSEWLWFAAGVAVGVVVAMGGIIWIMGVTARYVETVERTNARLFIPRDEEDVP